MDNNIIVHFLNWLGGFFARLRKNDLRGECSSSLKKEVKMASEKKVDNCELLSKYLVIMETKKAQKTPKDICM
jgi:hypothetical protein